MAPTPQGLAAGMIRFNLQWRCSVLCQLPPKRAQFSGLNFQGLKNLTETELQAPEVTQPRNSAV